MRTCPSWKSARNIHSTRTRSFSGSVHLQCGSPTSLPSPLPTSILLCASYQQVHTRHPFRCGTHARIQQLFYMCERKRAPSVRANRAYNCKRVRCVCVTLNWSFRSAVRCGALRMGVACMHVHKYICLCVWRLWVALGTRPSRCGGAVPAAMQVSAGADERAYGNYVSSSPLNRGQAPTYQRALSLQRGLNEIV